MKKQLMAGMMAASMALSLAACGGSAASSAAPAADSTSGAAGSTAAACACLLCLLHAASAICNSSPLVILSPGEKIILCQPDGCACRPSALLSFQRDRMFFRSVYHDCDSTHLKFCCHGCFYSKHGPSNQLRNL